MTNKQAILSFFLEVLDLYEFQLYVNKNQKFALIDNQHADLGNIEEEEFDTLADVVDRLDAYHEDYVYHIIGDGEYSKWDCLIIDFLESDIMASLLAEIIPEDFKESDFNIIGDADKIIEELIKTPAQTLRAKLRKEVFEEIKKEEKLNFATEKVDKYVFLSNVLSLTTEESLAFFAKEAEQHKINLTVANKIGPDILSLVWKQYSKRPTKAQTLVSTDFFRLLKEYLNTDIINKDEEIANMRDEETIIHRTCVGTIVKGKVKDWYVKNYPDDDLGQDIDSDITFKDVYEHLENFYDIIKVSDSVIRERIFEELAKLTNQTYDKIYKIWLGEED